MIHLTGKSLGPYRILEQIGIGGMATVYKAYQSGMDRYVAVKILPQHLKEDEQFAQRFQREARAIAKLEHAHILPVYDYGEQENITFIAMRYVEAGTLKEYMSKGPLPLEEINRLIGQIGMALDYAHRLGAIHRDVKPGNILVDSQGDTYLTDFGLARMMGSSQQFTGSGVSIGTPAYMSPEQGKGVKADHRSDIYALGIILYEMVTGRVPYEAETPLAVMLKHITDPLPLPREAKPDVPEPVERVILRALAKEPMHRFQTAGEMVHALNLAVHKAGAAAVEPARLMPQPEPTDVSLLTRVQQVWRRPRGKISLIGSVAVVVLLLGLLLSQIPGRLAIVGSGPILSAVAETTATATPTTVVQATPTGQTPTEVVSEATAQARAIVGSGPTLSALAETTATATPTTVVQATPTGQTPTEVVSEATAQANAFAEPILNGIAIRPPDYQDDFSNPHSGWETRIESESCCYGSVGYQNGEYVVIADPLKPLQIQESEGWNWARGNNEQIAPGLTDYVLEIDQYWVSESGLTSLHLCDSRGECYSIRLWSPDVSLDFWAESLFSTKPRTEFVNGLLIPWVTTLNQPTSLMVIKKGLEVAVYANGMPVYYILLPKEYQWRLDFIQLRVGTNSMDFSIEVHWDNLKIWELSAVASS